MKMRVSREFEVTIPEDTRHHEIVARMEQAAIDSGVPYTDEDYEPNVLRGNMAVFLTDDAVKGINTDLVEIVDYNVWDVEEES
jgi:hypothetical protein